MGTRTAVRLAWALWALTLAVMVPGVLLWATAGFPPPPRSEPVAGAGATFLVLTWTLTAALFATIGLVVATRRPRNPIGWLCILAGGMMACSMLASEYANGPALAEPGSPAPGAALVAWIGSLLAVWVAVIVPIVLFFPDGRLPGRRWGVVLWGEAATVLLALVGMGLRPGPLGTAPTLDNPFGVAAAADALAIIMGLATVGLLVCTLLAASALVLRLRRARSDERQQFKWVAYAASLWAAGLIGASVVPPAWNVFTQFGQFVTLAGLLVAVAVAVLKYRLYDVDLVINRTLVYGSLAALITSVYVALVVGLGTLIGTRGEPSLGLSVLATAAVAVAFQPARERVQRLANRLVYGHRASPYEVLAQFSRRMAEALSIDEVLPRMAEAAARGVGGSSARVRVFVPGGADRAVTWPADSLASTFDRTALVLHQGEPVGEIALAKAHGEALTPNEAVLLSDLAAQAGPALSNVRLALELRARLGQLARQADELRASRQRIVSAQDAERRRLERDIHDGAQQHLVAIAVNARLARQVLETAPVRTGALLEEISAQADDALETLRDLARGIFPAVLADRGLVPALRAHLGRSAASARLEADATVARARFDPRAEAALYFCCLEALQNAAKHAAGAAVSVRVCADQAWLTLAVCDRGPGFRPEIVHHGTGLQGMLDRMAAVGGTLEVVSAEGEGTTIRGRAPREVALTRAQVEATTAAQAAASAAEPNAALAR
jgi:signal transduction histidine kinase